MAVATPAWADFLASLPLDDGADRRKLSAQDTLSLALKGDLTAGELNSTDELLPLGIRMGLTAEALLLVQLLISFDRRGEDPELDEWMNVRKAPGRPFFLFMMKASAKSAQVLWWKKKKFHFSPERPGYTAALRIARLGADGVHLEQAGEGGQPGALCYHIDMGYLKLRRPKGVVVFEEGSNVPLTEVALIRRLPRGDGISITSHVSGLGVQLGDMLFMLPCCAATVALSFEEKSFTVPTEFTEEPLYGKVGLNFIDITGPIENLIKKLYSMYEQEQQDNKALLQQQNKGDHGDRVELMYCREDPERERVELVWQRKEQEEKLENLQRRRAERNKYKEMRKEVKRMIGNFKQGAKIDEGFKEINLEEESIRDSIFRIFELDEGTGSGAVSKGVEGHEIS